MTAEEDGGQKLDEMRPKWLEASGGRQPMEVVVEARERKRRKKGRI